MYAVFNRLLILQIYSLSHKKAPDKKEEHEHLETRNLVEIVPKFEE